MFPNRSSQPETMSLAHLQSTATSIVSDACSVVSAPLDFILRPQFGSRYFSVPVFALSALMMIVLPVTLAMITSLEQMIPFSHPAPPVGMLGIGSLSELFFILLLVHAWRIYRRILNPQSEKHSRYEGPPLPVFAFLPWSSAWGIRIVAEPAFVFIAATIMQDLHIFQSGLTLYLRVAALALAIRGSIAYMQVWEVLRDVMDMGSAAPILSKLVDNQATPEELEPVHLASLPRDLPDGVRAQAAASIARSYGQNQ